MTEPQPPIRPKRHPDDDRSDDQRTEDEQSDKGGDSDVQPDPARS